MSTLMPRPKVENPTISPDIFENDTWNGKAYWVGRIAMLDGLKQQEVFEATSLLRGSIYTKLGFLDPERLDDQGREFDDDDYRSVHFTVIEKLEGENQTGEATTIGTSRLIIKDSMENPLPIEHKFPEVFGDLPAPIGSAEGSRLIANHDRPSIQYLAGLALIRAMTHYSLANKIKADYGMAEEPLLRLFARSGIPTKIIGHSKLIKELGGTLYPIEIEVSKMAGPQREVGKSALRSFFESGAQNLGEGFYDQTFLS